MNGKNIPIEEQKKFLESRMNEEEIAEAFRRAKLSQSNDSSAPDSNTGIPQQAMGRMQQVDGHFQPMMVANPNSGGLTASSLATVASVSIISALGLTYLLDKRNDK